MRRRSGTRGYTLDFHRVMAAADFEWLQKYNQFIEATYTGQRTLDRKTKELLQVAVEAALRADVSQIQEHVRLALENGATPTEVLEALEAVIAPMGAPCVSTGASGVGGGSGNWTRTSLKWPSGSQPWLFPTGKTYRTLTSWRELTGVCTCTFHPHPSPLPEGADRGRHLVFQVRR